MEVQEFGKENGRRIVLIPGNMMSWRQFENVIPLLQSDYRVIAVSTDGYDGTGETTFTTAEASADKLESYIREHLNGEIDLVFGESFGGATAGILFHRQSVRVGSLILSGPQYMSLGPVNALMKAVIPKSQYRLLGKVSRADKLPWLLRLYTRGDDQALLRQFANIPAHISLHTLQNATSEALALYRKIDGFDPDPSARVAVWYGAREPNMKKALEKLKRAFPAAEDHPFPGFGHGDIIAHPALMAAEIRRFLPADTT